LLCLAGPCLPLDGNFALGNFIRDVIRGGPIEIAGDGTPLRSYLYTADFVVWLWTIFFRGAPMTAYNVGSENAISIGDTARLVAATLEPTIEVRRTEQPVERAAPLQYVPSTASAAGLHLRETVDVTQSIQRTAEWYG
jgi:dTDP-glucose 4,6-dehydratase